MFYYIKKMIYILTILLCVLTFTGCVKEDIEGSDDDYINSYYVITRNVNNGKISYFEVSNSGNKMHRRKTNEFEGEKFDEIVYIRDCFDIKNNNAIMNSCKLISDFGEVPLVGIYEKITKQISLLNHYMFDVKIYKKNDDYYVVREENVNIYSPFELYKYNNTDNVLELICHIPDEEIINFRKKEK